KLEGPEVVTDPAKAPKTFKEAPQLAELVKAGKLPPVAERIGQDPLVIKPLHEIGKYGGTWRAGFTGPADFWNGFQIGRAHVLTPATPRSTLFPSRPLFGSLGRAPRVIKPLHEIGKYGGTWRAGFTGPADFWNGFRCCSGPDHLMFWDYTGDKVVPNIAKGLEMQEGGRAWLVHLRRGMKWSDGKPFTADDFVFWFEDIYRNKDLVPTPSAAMAINGKQGVIEKVD